MSSSMIVMTASLPSSYLMELDAIMSITFGSIESDIRQIVPDREECRINEVRQEELIEHEEYPEREDRILVRHDVPVEPRWLQRYIESRLSDPAKNIADAKDVALLDHIDKYGSESKKEIKRYKKIYERIESRLGRFMHDESSMEWKEKCENKDEVDGYTHDKNSKSCREESSLASEYRIPK
jgi:hypothetical protein